MPSLNLKDADLYYHCLGAEGSNRSPVIMIHGLLLGNSATWYFGAASALAKSHRVVVYDLRGHGMSAKASQGYDLKTMVSDLKALFESQGFSRVSLVGHSYGALIALH
ncbi:MAG: alpha/beta hydrolase, partial [Proteobacteria bacterium]